MFNLSIFFGKSWYLDTHLIPNNSDLVDQIKPIKNENSRDK